MALNCSNVFRILRIALANLINEAAVGVLPLTPHLTICSILLIFRYQFHDPSNSINCKSYVHDVKAVAYNEYRKPSIRFFGMFIPGRFYCIHNDNEMLTFKFLCRQTCYCSLFSSNYRVTAVAHSSAETSWLERPRTAAVYATPSRPQSTLASAITSTSLHRLSERQDFLNASTTSPMSFNCVTVI